MKKGELDISLSTLIQTSSLLGLRLEDFSPVRERQNQSLVEELQKESTVSLVNPDQKKHFYLSAIDFLAYDDGNEKKFKFTEINGSGFTGLSNISIPNIQTVIKELQTIPKHINDEVPVVIVPCSGTKAISTSGRPSLMYEKILFAQAIKEGFEKERGSADLVTLYDIVQAGPFKPTKPTVVIGYLIDLMEYLSCIDGKMYFLGFPLSGATHDRFCDNLINAFKDEIDLNQFYSINNLFYITSDKGTAYKFFHEFRKTRDFKSFDKEFDFARVFNRKELIDAVLDRVKAGKRTVIKPHGAALGRGIEFFVIPEDDEQIINKIDCSLEAVNRFCGVEGWAFPYTVVNFVDCCTIPKKDYPLFGHKYEMRVIVYRDDDKLKAFPSIVKISSKKYEADVSDRLMLLNNVAAAAGRTKLESYNYMLPLSNMETLEVLGLKLDDLKEICSFSTEYVRYAIDKIDTNPMSLYECYCSDLPKP